MVELFDSVRVFCTFNKFINFCKYNYFLFLYNIFEEKKMKNEKKIEKLKKKLYVTLRGTPGMVCTCERSAQAYFELYRRKTNRYAILYSCWNV